LRLCDGCDWVEVLLPVGDERAAEAFAWPIDDPQGVRKLADTKKHVILRSKQRQRVEMAFVDRRLSLALNGQLLLEVDLPEATTRQGVVRPFQVQADGVEARLHRFRLYRDVHYGQQGRNAVHGKSVRLGADQYFMLGDNSPNSEDSRWWPDDGRVRAADLIGPMVKSSRLVSP
jgi:signal peptidase I